MMSRAVRWMRALREFIDLIAANNEDVGDTADGRSRVAGPGDRKESGKKFVDDVRSAEQTETAGSDRISKKSATPDKQPGVVFFDWMRRLTADAFYTSPIGVKDVGYHGNKGMTKFEVPVAAIEYASNAADWAEAPGFMYNRSLRHV